MSLEIEQICSKFLKKFRSLGEEQERIKMFDLSIQRTT